MVVKVVIKICDFSFGLMDRDHYKIFVRGIIILSN